MKKKIQRFIEDNGGLWFAGAHILFVYFLIKNLNPSCSSKDAAGGIALSFMIYPILAAMFMGDGD